MILGNLHGMVVVVLLVMLAGLTSLPHEPWQQESKLLPPFQVCAIWLPDPILSGLAEYVHYR